MSEVILVLGMQAGFLKEGYPLFYGEAARAIIPSVVKLIKSRPQALVVYILDEHAMDDRLCKLFQPHCLRGTEEAELIEELLPFPGITLVKTRHSAFEGARLEQLLKEKRPGRVILAGLAADLGILHTAAGLLERDIPAVIPLDCAASRTAEVHHWAIEHLQRALGVELSESWRTLPPPPSPPPPPVREEEPPAGASLTEAAGETAVTAVSAEIPEPAEREGSGLFEPAAEAAPPPAPGSSDQELAESGREAPAEAEPPAAIPLERPEIRRIAPIIGEPPAPPETPSGDDKPAVQS